MSSAPPPSGSGELIAGKYQLEHELGRGGMGAVYAARHVATGRRFAIKMLNRELAGDPEAEARFLREATLASAINHPAIVEVYDVGRHGEAPYMVMKLLTGETLGQRIKRGPLPPDELVAIMLPVLNGVAAAHARGILHRDLKPDNILIANEGQTVQPKVLDFGISKLLTADARTRLTRTGVSIGTPLYMSPEQVRGAHDVDARSDVYSLGVILYEALTGALPYEGNNYADLVLKIITGNAPTLREWNPSLPAALEAVVARAMAVDRNERFANVSELAAELARFTHVRASAGAVRVSQRPAARASSTPFATEAGSRRARARSRAGLYAAGVVSVVALLAGLAFLLWTADSRPGAVPASAARPSAVLEVPEGAAAASPATVTANSGAAAAAAMERSPNAEAAPQPASTAQPVPEAAQPTPEIAPAAHAPSNALAAAADEAPAQERPAAALAPAQTRPRAQDARPRAAAPDRQREEPQPRSSNTRPRITDEIIDPFE